MGQIQVRKHALKYVLKDFENRVFHWNDNTETHIEYIFSEDELFAISDKDLVREKTSLHSLQKLAQTKFKALKKVLKTAKITEEVQTDIFFMIIYIKAGIESNPDFIIFNDMHKNVTRNILLAKIISLGDLSEIKIIIKPKEGGGVKFNNLQHLNPDLLNNVLKSIATSVQLDKTDKEAYQMLTNPKIKAKQLESKAESYKNSALDKKNEMIIKGADAIVKYLNDNNIYVRKGANYGTEEQLLLITRSFSAIGIDAEEDDLRNFRERLRYLSNK
jgi:hypothetical protein